MAIFMSVFAVVHGLDLREEYKQRLFCYGCKLWLFAFGAIVRHHGRKEREGTPHLYVCNHTSFTDYFLLSSHCFPHAALAQVHGGLFGILQKYLLSALGSLAFNRDEQRDRIIVSEGMKAHAADLGKAPLLVFPEGTCVNNEATVLFHKGAFELGAAVVPVAIKYNKRLLDPYWNTREQSFTQHVLYLMTRWVMIVDVWWLPMQEIQPSESAIEFSNRVKAMISEAAGLTDLSWDGYMKNYMKAASRDKLLLKMQRQYATTLKSDLLAAMEQSGSSSTESLQKHSRKQRSMSAITIDELERRSPLQQFFVFPEWLSEQALVDIKNAIMNRRFHPSMLSGRRLSDGEDGPHPAGSDGKIASPRSRKDD
jgi:1-acyl-sn-glycerol-3-phosphate acyltransferase